MNDYQREDMATYSAQSHYNNIYAVGVHTEKFDYYIFIPYSRRISRNPIFVVFTDKCLTMKIKQAKKAQL